MSSKNKVGPLLLMAAAFLFGCQANSKNEISISFPGNQTNIETLGSRSPFIGAKKVTYATPYPGNATIERFEQALRLGGFEKVGALKKTFGSKTGIATNKLGDCQVGYWDRWKNEKSNTGIFISYTYVFPCSRDLPGNSDSLEVTVFEYERGRNALPKSFGQE